MIHNTAMIVIRCINGTVIIITISGTSITNIIIVIIIVITTVIKDVNLVAWEVLRGIWKVLRRTQFVLITLKTIMTLVIVIVIKSNQNSNEHSNNPNKHNEHNICLGPQRLTDGVTADG